MKSGNHFARCAIPLLITLSCLSAFLPGHAGTIYVSTNSAVDGPGTDWANAFHAIQDAANAATNGDTVLVTNGTYFLTSHILITNNITVASVNGAKATTVDGQDMCRGFELTNSCCMIQGFTITNGYAAGLGGGVHCTYTNAILLRCIVTDCSASHGGGGYYGRWRECIIRNNHSDDRGGGVCYGYYDSCLILCNTAPGDGGGVHNATLRNCTVSGNTAGNGGGVYLGWCCNSIVWGNTATNQGNDIGAHLSTPYNTCASDGIGDGENCITNDPLMNPDFSLQGMSPCINAGDDQWVSHGLDMSGNPRISGIRVDMGAYECQFTNIYVDASQPDDSGSGWTWASAKKSIQAGVDIATTNIPVVLTNGTYLLTSEVVISNAITVMGFNGPAVTIVNGQDVCRCFYLGNAACTLSDLTITNGNSPTAGGGVYCTGTTPLITNCVVSGNAATLDAGGVNRGTVVNCIVRGNHAGDEGGATSHSEVLNSFLSENSSGTNAGGAFRGTLVGCTIEDNTTIMNGGGAYEASLTHCTLAGNSSGGQGGGAFACSLVGCALTNNASDNGGGSCEGTLTDCSVLNNHADAMGGGVCSSLVVRCVLKGNVANQNGGGAYGGGLLSCLLTANTAMNYGGGACNAALTNCTLFGNACDYRGGGISGGIIMNCIVWSNTASDTGKDIYTGAGSNTCASDGVTNGVNGCTTNNPLFADASAQDFYLLPASPCINGGRDISVGETDLAGNPRVVGPAPDMGALEFQYNAVYVDVNQPDDSRDGFSWDTAKKTIQAGVDLQPEMVWVSNGVYALTSQIDVPSAMIIRSVNGPEATIVDGQGSCRGFDLNIHAVYLDGFTVTNGYAAGSSGGGVYAATPDSSVITNCIISGNESGNMGGGVNGGTLYNCILSGNISSSQGGGARYCVMYDCEVSHNGSSSSGAGGVSFATLYHCSIYSNSSYSSGGGAEGSQLYHCTVYGNAVRSPSGDGGGLYNCDAYDCVIRDNQGVTGGGTHDGRLYNCTVVNNHATNTGGGGYQPDAYNCVFWGNTASGSGNDLALAVAAQNTCASDGITNGVNGCITNDPLFTANGDFRLQAGSPCINVGSNEYVSSASDLADNPRIVNTIVDMGAYEYIYSATDYDGDGMLNAWENRHGLDEVDSADRLLNPDGDVFDNMEEYIADTDPQNSNSYFHLTHVDERVSCAISFVCTNSRVYSLGYATNLINGAWIPVNGATNVPGSGSSMSLTDSVDSVYRNYRVRVSLP